MEYLRFIWLKKVELSGLVDTTMPLDMSDIDEYKRLSRLFGLLKEFSVRGSVSSPQDAKKLVYLAELAALAHQPKESFLVLKRAYFNASPASQDILLPALFERTASWGTSGEVIALAREVRLDSRASSKEGRSHWPVLTEKTLQMMDGVWNNNRFYSSNGFPSLLIGLGLDYLKEFSSKKDSEAMRDFVTKSGEFVYERFTPGDFNRYLLETLAVLPDDLGSEIVEFGMSKHLKRSNHPYSTAREFALESLKVCAGKQKATVLNRASDLLGSTQRPDFAKYFLQDVEKLSFNDPALLHLRPVIADKLGEYATNNDLLINSTGYMERLLRRSKPQNRSLS